MTKLIISFDGGGIRGVATSQFLKRLENKIDKTIYDSFDMFVGTSTGGIIAAALGVLKYNATQISDIYNYENSNTIMNKSFWDKKMGLIQNQPKYNGIGKRKILEKYFAAKLFNDAIKPTMVITYDIEARKSDVLKSHDKENILALSAVDASSASPFYFPTVKVNGRWLIDGGVIANNPTMCAYAEAIHLWPNEEIRILSIGTGNHTRKINGEESQNYGCYGWVTHDFLGIVMDETVVDYQIDKILGNKVLRVNSELDYVNDDMDDCSKGNIKNLKRLGDKWFDKFGEKAKKLIS